MNEPFSYVLQNYYCVPAPLLLSCMWFRPLSPRGTAISMTMPMLMYGRKYQQGVNWITAIAMSGFHVGAIAALFYVDVGAMLTAAVLWVMAGSLGIGMGYHRLLTHRGY